MKKIIKNDLDSGLGMRLYTMRIKSLRMEMEINGHFWESEEIV
jgi:hypothetical protein